MLDKPDHELPGCVLPAVYPFAGWDGPGVGLGFYPLCHPQPEYVDIGRLSDFPPSADPYFVNIPRPVFVLNYNDELLVLDLLNRVKGGAPVRWRPLEQAYIDPSRGTWFNRYGNPIHNPGNVDYPVEKHGLLRYPVSFRGDRIIIEVSRLRLDIP